MASEGCWCVVVSLPGYLLDYRHCTKTKREAIAIAKEYKNRIMKSGEHRVSGNIRKDGFYVTYWRNYEGEWENYFIIEVLRVRGGKDKEI